MSKEKGPGKDEEQEEKVASLNEWKVENQPYGEKVRKLEALQTSLSDKLHLDPPQDLPRYVKREANHISKIKDETIKRNFYFAEQKDIEKDPIHFAVLLITGVNRGVFENPLYQSYAESYSLELPGLGVKEVDDVSSKEDTEPLTLEELVNLKNYFHGIDEELSKFSSDDWDELEKIIESDISSRWMMSELENVGDSMDNDSFIRMLAYTYKCVREGLIEDDDWSDFFQNLVNLVNKGLSDGRAQENSEEDKSKILEFKPKEEDN